MNLINDQLVDISVVETEIITDSQSINKNEADGIAVSSSIRNQLNINLTNSSRDIKNIKNTKISLQKKKISIAFSGITPTLNKLLDTIKTNRVWILLDEWSAIPFDLQPLLADMIRRTLYTSNKLSVKIGAIEIRSNFIIKYDHGTYVGIELGADCQADINLDDFMVFDNNSKKSEDFFAELLFKHVISIDPSLNLKDKMSFIRQCFTQNQAFSELVRSAEGVPRDAINIIMIAVQNMPNDKISVSSIRKAAKQWYDSDKSAALSPVLRQLLNWIVEKVIKDKKARGFILNQKYYNNQDQIRELVDCRVLHLIKRGYSAQDLPGERFDVYFIDYGCYVELMTTKSAPNDNLEEVFDTVSVPFDDYRSLRRAILDPSEFEASIC